MTVLKNSNGTAVSVFEDMDEHGYLAVNNETEAEHATHEGNGFCIPVSVTPTGAGDYFCYLELADGAPANLVITEITFRCAAAEVVSIESAATGTPANTAALTVASRHTSFGTVGVDKLLAYQGVNLDSGSGLDGATNYVIGRTSVALAQFPGDYKPSGNIVLGPGRALQFLAATGTAAITMEILCHWSHIVH